MNKSLSIALSIALMLAILVFPIQTALSENLTSKLEVGISLHSCNGNDAKLVKDSEAQWIRIDVDSNFKQVVANAKNENLKVLGILGSWMFGKSTTFNSDQWTQAVTDYVSNNTNVDAWEIWNEPSNTAYPLMTNNATDNLTQTVQNYYWMVKTSSSIIRQYTPSAKIVLLGGMQIYTDSNQVQVDKEFARQLSHTNISLYGDTISIHAYDWNENIQGVLTQYSQNLNYYRSLFNNLPVWVTETGQPTEYSEELGQATYLTTALQFFNDKTSNVFWYSLYDNPDEVSSNPTQHFGLISSDGIIRKAYLAMQQFMANQNITPQPTTTPSLVQNNVDSILIHQKIIQYLENCYYENPNVSEIHLISVTPDNSSFYFLVSDNLLAYYALRNDNPKISNEIATTLKNNALPPRDSNGFPISYKHEAIIGDVLPEINNQITFKNAINYPINSTQGWNIVTEINNNNSDPVNESISHYADLFAYRGISYFNSNNSPEAKAQYNEIMNQFWNGYGFVDDAFNNTTKEYSTYKLGLALILANKLGISDSNTSNMLKIIEKCQDSQSGGIHTEYKVDDGLVSYSGQTNTETTSIIAIATENAQDSGTGIFLNLIGVFTAIIIIVVIVVFVKLKVAKNQNGNRRY